MQVEARGCFLYRCSNEVPFFGLSSLLLPWQIQHPSPRRVGARAGHCNGQLSQVVYQPSSVSLPSLYAGLQMSAGFIKDGLNVSCSHCFWAVWEEAEAGKSMLPFWVEAVVPFYKPEAPSPKAGIYESFLYPLSSRELTISRPINDQSLIFDSN